MSGLSNFCVVFSSGLEALLSIFEGRQNQRSISHLKPKLYM